MKTGDIYIKVLNKQNLFWVIKSISINDVVFDFILIVNNGVLNFKTDSISIEEMESIIDRAGLRLIENYHVSHYEHFITLLFNCDIASVR